MKGQTYYDRIAKKILEDGMKEIDKIEDRKLRLEALSRLMARPVIECLNDLDERLRKLEVK